MITRSALSSSSCSGPGLPVGLPLTCCVPVSDGESFTPSCSTCLTAKSSGGTSVKTSFGGAASDIEKVLPASPG